MKFHWSVVVYPLSLMLWILLSCCGCTECTNLSSTTVQTVIYFKSLDTVNFKIDHLYIQEKQHTTTDETLHANEFVLPLNAKLFTIYCYATNGKVDTAVIINDHSLKLHTNDGPCGDAHELIYTRFSIRPSFHTFDSAYMRYGNAGDAQSWQHPYYKDTLYFKP